METLKRIPVDLLEIIDEIFVFDDASVDDTYGLGLSMSEDNYWKGKLRVYKNPRNLGYGGNQKIGFQYAIEKGLDIVILLHGDGQYAPEFLPDLLWAAVIEEESVVFGSRMMTRGGALKGGMPLYKWLGNKILTGFENLVLGLSMSEYHSGYRLYSLDVLKRIPFRENTDDFHFDTQIIVQCRALGIMIKEVSIPTFYGDEICYVNGIKYAMDVCLDVVQYRLHQLHVIRRSRYIVNRGAKYGRKFSPYGSHVLIAKLVANGDRYGRILDLGGGSELIYEECVRQGMTAKTWRRNREQAMALLRVR